jgi:uncharacterized protein with NRDE domain
MCLILFAWQSHPHYPLVVAANRDEFHERPTSAADFWSESPDILAGRDLEAGGTWLGVSRNGRFGAISNYREGQLRTSPRGYSRGNLVSDFLRDWTTPAQYAEQLRQKLDHYNGFNLLAGHADSLVYTSNRASKPMQVSPGVHGLSNHLLDTDWPKVNTGCARLQSLLEDAQIDTEALLELLADRSAGAGARLSVEELRSEPEKLTRRIFIDSPVYGTRSSTVILMDRNGLVSFVERQFDASGKIVATRHFEFGTGEPV